jgi:hypothetical protein
MAGLLPGARALDRPQRAQPSMEASPGYLGIAGQCWGVRDTPHASLVLVAFESQAAAFRARDRCDVLRSVPWRKVWRKPIGERCRYEPQFGWAVEFSRGNVYVSVHTDPGDEQLARGIARLLDTKINRALDQP